MQTSKFTNNYLNANGMRPADLNKYLFSTAQRQEKTVRIAYPI